MARPSSTSEAPVWGLLGGERDGSPPREGVGSMPRAVIGRRRSGPSGRGGGGRRFGPPGRRGGRRAGPSGRCVTVCARRAGPFDSAATLCVVSPVDEAVEPARLSAHPAGSDAGPACRRRIHPASPIRIHPVAAVPIRIHPSPLRSRIHPVRIHPAELSPRRRIRASARARPPTWAPLPPRTDRDTWHVSWRTPLRSVEPSGLPAPRARLRADAGRWRC